MPKVNAKSFEVCTLTKIEFDKTTKSNKEIKLKMSPEEMKWADENIRSAWSQTTVLFS